MQAPSCALHLCTQFLLVALRALAGRRPWETSAECLANSVYISSVLQARIDPRASALSKSKQCCYNCYNVNSDRIVNGTPRESLGGRRPWKKNYEERFQAFLQNNSPNNAAATSEAWCRDAFRHLAASNSMGGADLKKRAVGHMAPNPENKSGVVSKKAWKSLEQSEASTLGPRLFFL